MRRFEYNFLIVKKEKDDGGHYHHYSSRREALNAVGLQGWQVIYEEEYDDRWEYLLERVIKRGWWVKNVGS